MLDIEKIIIKSKNFTICTIKKPHIDRSEGGHIVIACDNPMYINMEDMPQEVLHEFIDIASICGRYMKDMFDEEKIDVGIINYQVNGNWSVLRETRDPIHMHLYGRTKHSKKQPYGKALFLPDSETGFYDNNKSLNNSEIMFMREKLLNNKIVKKYLEKNERNRSEV